MSASAMEIFPLKNNYFMFDAWICQQEVVIVLRIIL